MIFAQHNVYDAGECAQIEAFDDTWYWTPETDRQYKAAISETTPRERIRILTPLRLSLLCLGGSALQPAPRASPAFSSPPESAFRLDGTCPSAKWAGWPMAA